MTRKDMCSLSQNPPGIESKLSDLERMLFVDYVLIQNENHVDFHLEDGVKFIWKNFQEKVTPQTVLNYLRQNGFALHRTKSKTEGYKLTEDGVILIIVE